MGVVDAMTRGVYRIACDVTGQCYIGSSTNIENRFKKHLYLLRHNKHLNYRIQRAWDEYGEQQFKWEIIEVVPSEGYLPYYEQKYLDQLDASSLNISSKTKHYTEHFKLSEWAKERVGEASRKKVMSPEARRRISVAQKGKPVSVTTREKMRRNGLGRRHTQESIAKMQAAKRGRKLTEEHKTKIRATLMGNKRAKGLNHSDEFRAKMRELMKGNKRLLGHIPSTETRNKLSIAGKRRYARLRELGLANAKAHQRRLIPND